ncbi:MAG: glycosyltransferase [Rikenellaceae bacterium]
MKILHYTLGLAPQRSGGMTKYATDLMMEQARQGHDVTLLYPCGYRWWSDITYSKKGAKENSIQLYKLKNSLPIPLLYGIKSPKDFIASRRISEKAMESLYNDIKPDVFHVHTLMGLPIELLQFLKHKGVKLIYTSHDYFGICPKVNLIDFDGKLCCEPSAERCSRCNQGSKSTLYLRLRNSQAALNMKNNPFLRKILK